jgi:exosome complex RNA-binding protein Csl4
LTLFCHVSSLVISAVHLLPPAAQVRMEECFKPGDIVRAVVASLGDSRSYFLSTARDDLGVVYGRADDGSALAAQAAGGGAGGGEGAMLNPATGVVEKRKVARLGGAAAASVAAGGAARS